MQSHVEIYLNRPVSVGGATIGISNLKKKKKLFGLSIIDSYSGSSQVLITQTRIPKTDNNIVLQQSNSREKINLA